jgi:hypothetical protein
VANDQRANQMAIPLKEGKQNNNNNNLKYYIKRKK